ncbi:MAG: CNNM domain-containing protein, partial [Dehalococcoidia bacterium]|nr:CNNM domain-containing protein [Dehalococcoidia bacterium]
MMDGDFLSLALVLVLLALSAFFSSSESAFLSVQRTRLAHLVSEGVPGARRVAEMIGEPERLLATILLGNNVVNAATTAVITATVVAFVGGASEPAGVTPAGVVIATAISTIALVLFGEIIPKTIAVRNAERVAFLYSRPLTWTEYLLLPFVVILQWATRGLNALLGGNISDRRSITEDEFRSLIDIGEAEGEFEPAEAEMLENVFQFGDRQVKEVMTPRTGMITIHAGRTLRG